MLDPVNSFTDPDTSGSTTEEWRSVPTEREPVSPPIEDERDFEFPFAESALRTDVLYRLWAAGKAGNAFSGLFGASELAALRPEEVMTQSSAAADGVYEIMTRASFEACADEFCE